MPQGSSCIQTRRLLIQTIAASCILPAVISVQVTRGITQNIRFEHRARKNAESSSDVLNQAIEECFRAGGGTVLIEAGNYFLSSPVRLRTGVHIQGKGSGSTTLQLAEGCAAAFWDGNEAQHDILISGMTILGAASQIGTTRARGVWLDAQGERFSENIAFRDLKFKSLFRGIEVDHVNRLSYDRIAGETLADSLIYIGEGAENRSADIRHGTVWARNCLTVAKENGGGIVVISYADNIGCQFDVSAQQRAE